MTKTFALDPIHSAFADAADKPAALHPQSLLELPPGEARQSLLTVHSILEAKLPATDLKIYEAGGGSTSFLPLNVLRRAHVTVVDIDEDQIRNNDYAQETILGDIQTYRFAPDSFDLVICYNVIEHVPDVEAALLGFCQSLKDNGLILIGAPNPRSLSGVVTKYSPHWFHVWFYRHVRGDKNAGLPGCAPFPTHFHPLVTLSNLEAFADRHGLQMIYRKQYESPRYPEMRRRKPLFAALVDAAAKVMNFFLPGKDRRAARRLSRDPAKALKMNAMFSEARVKVSHRLAMHLHANPFQMRNATPMVSFTFDDLPKSAATTGADLLEAHGARGTFYVSGGLVGVGTPDWPAGDADDVLSLYRRGHEIGCHTFSHQRACDLDVASLANEIMRNRGYFRALDASIETETFAYPYGYGSFGRKHQLKDQFQTCRSIVPGINSGEVDLQFLRAMPLIDRQIDRVGIERAFDEARNQ